MIFSICVRAYMLYPFGNDNIVLSPRYLVTPSSRRRYFSIKENTIKSHLFYRLACVPGDYLSSGAVNCPVVGLPMGVSTLSTTTTTTNGNTNNNNNNDYAMSAGGDSSRCDSHCEDSSECGGGGSGGGGVGGGGIMSYTLSRYAGTTSTHLPPASCLDHLDDDERF